jgi:hypothetical protein
MKKTGIILLVFVMHLTSVAQDVPIKRNTIYTEYCGQGFWNSLSFDRLYRTNKKIKTSITAGVTLLPMYKKWNMFIIAVPVSYNWIFGKKNNHLELGTGLTYFSETSKTQYSDIALIRVTNSYLYFTPKIGYRFQKQDGGFFFRFTLTPSVGLIDNFGVLKHGQTIYSKGYTYYPPYASGPFAGAGIGWRSITPWAGFSFGYTIK